jgi:hypothetical protein
MGVPLHIWHRKSERLVRRTRVVWNSANLGMTRHCKWAVRIDDGSLSRAFVISQDYFFDEGFDIDEKFYET